jgi:hypothetical protein
MYGTGWMAPNGKYGNYPPQNTYVPPPPQYSANAPVPNQYTGQTYNSNVGYYGPGHAEGVQPPPNSYYPRAGEPVYQPPVGPPPGK